MFSGGWGGIIALPLVIALQLAGWACSHPGAAGSLQLRRLAGKQEPYKKTTGFFPNVLMPLEARAHLCPNMLFANVPLRCLGGRNRAPKYRSRAELQGKTSASCPAKGSHGATAPRGDHSGLLEQSHCCDVGLGRKARKGEGPSALKCMGHCRHQSPLSSFSERWGTDPLKCRASVPFPLARDIRSPPLQALGPARLAETQAVAGSRHCVHPMDLLLLLHTHETPRCPRSGRKRWVCLGGLTTSLACPRGVVGLSCTTWDQQGLHLAPGIDGN